MPDVTRLFNRLGADALWHFTVLPRTELISVGSCASDPAAHSLLTIVAKNPKVALKALAA
jgi:hypothetical protein